MDDIPGVWDPEISWFGLILISFFFFRFVVGWLEEEKSEEIGDCHGGAGGGPGLRRACGVSG